jgi:apolipoprotein N-acyltransferase
MMQAAFKTRYYLYALIAGALLVLSFAPFNLFPMAYLSPAALFYLMVKARQRNQMVKLGWAFGVGLFGVGASWVFQSMHGFAQAPLLLAGLLTFLFVLGLALQIALFGFIASFFSKSLLILKLLIIYPCAWVLVEWFRGWLFTGFPWLLLGHSQTDTWLASYVPIGGTLLLSLATAVIAGSVVAILSPSRTERFHQVNLPAANYVRVAEPFSHLNKVLGSLTVLALLVSGWYFEKHHSWVEETGKTLKVSLLQANIPQDQKWLPEQRVPSVERYMHMTRDNWQSDLIVWPETAIPGEFTQFADFVLKPMQAEALANNTKLVVGGFHQTPEGRFENSVMVLGDNTATPDMYSKRHLVPLGEYIPLLQHLRWLERWMSIPYDNLSRGTGDGLVNVGEYRAQVSICYEDVFGEEMIRDLPEADFLINVTNDGWFSGSLQPTQHMQIARLRALETGRYLLRATNTGVSGIVDHKGVITSTVPSYQQGVVNGEVRVLQGTTPYVKYGNSLIVALVSSILFILYLFVRRKKVVL